MKNPYLIRTAAVASLAAAVLTAGYLGMPADEMQIAPQTLAASSVTSAEPAVYFPAGFEMKVGAEEGAVHEYY